MTMIIDGTNGLTFPDTSKQYNSYYSFKNRIINGAMVIDQRNAGASVSTSAGSAVFTVDRWKTNYSQTSKYTIQQNAGSVTPPAGFTKYLGVTSSSAYSVLAADFFLIRHLIEGFNTADLAWGTANAATVTLSFWVRSSLTGTFGGSICNNGDARSYPFTFTISAANTWEQKTVTIPGDTSGTWETGSSAGIIVTFGLGVGSTYSGTANAWAGSTFYSATGATSVVGTNGATFYITGVQLEKGIVATSFDYRPYGTELALCQRYYYRIKADAANRLLSEYGQCFSTTGFLVAAQFPVTMRTRPTALEQDGTAGDYKVFGADTTSRSCNTVPTYNSNTSENFALIEGTVASGLVAGNATVMSSVNSSAYLGWSAEL